MEIRVPKDTHTPVQTLPLCFAFNSVLGLINTAKSTMRHSQSVKDEKAKALKVKLRARESVILVPIRIMSRVTFLFTDVFMKER